MGLSRPLRWKSKDAILSGDKERPRLVRRDDTAGTDLYRRARIDVARKDARTHQVAISSA